jgi:hypothetical protein
MRTHPFRWTTYEFRERNLELESQARVVPRPHQVRGEAPVARSGVRRIHLPLIGFYIGVFLALSSGLSPNAKALPIFARKYKTTCFSCHVSEPMLNEFGRRFQANGYRIANSEPKTPTWDQLPLLLGMAVTPAVVYAHSKDNLTNTVTDSRNFETYGVDLFTAGDFSSRLSWYGDLTVDPGEGAGIESFFLIYHAGDMNFTFGKQILRTLFPIQFTLGTTDYSAQSYDPFGDAGLSTTGVPAGGANTLLMEEASYAASVFGWVPDILNGFRYEVAVTSGNDGVDLNDARALFVSADQTVYYANNAPFRLGAWYYAGKQRLYDQDATGAWVFDGHNNSPWRLGVGADIYDPWMKKIDLTGQYMIANDDHIYNGSSFGQQRMTGSFVGLTAILLPEKMYAYGRWDNKKVDELNLTDTQWTVGLKYHLVPNVYLFAETSFDSQQIPGQFDMSTTTLSVGTGFAY